MKKIIYFHGLGGSRLEWELVDLLKEECDIDIVSINLDYEMLRDNDDALAGLDNYIDRIKPDYIAGNSMGGFFAYHYSGFQDVPCILFNPALSDATLSHERFHDSVAGTMHGDRPCEVHYSEKDKVVDMNKTADFLKEEDANATIKIATGCRSHSLPINYILGSIINFVK